MGTQALGVTAVKQLLIKIPVKIVYLQTHTEVLSY